MKTYKLIRNNETIEEDIETIEEAEYLKAEYQIAYRWYVSIKVQY